MRRPLLQVVIATCLLFFCTTLFAQTPDLGSVADFVLFSSKGNIKNTGNSNFTGNVGTNSGSCIGFGNVNGVIHMTDSSSASCANDLDKAYNVLNEATPAFFPAPVLGNGDTLNPGVYSIKGNASLKNSLTLDAKGNTNAVFIFKFQGTFSSVAAAKVNLINGAQSYNVFWKTEGAISLATGTTMKGTLVAHNAIVNISAGVLLEGRVFSTSGDVIVSKITANTPTGCGSSLLTGPVAPVLASITGFALFSADGTVINKGSTTVRGDVGTNVSFTEGYDSTKVTGVIHSLPDGSTATSAYDVLSLYNYLHSLSPDIELLYPASFGNKLVLTPHAYLLNTATYLTDTLYVNAAGNVDAVFVIKVNGAFATNANSKVLLINGAQASNVFWIVDGPVNLSKQSDFAGTIVGNGAISLNDAVVNGRVLTTGGALNTASSVITVPACCNETIVSSTYTWVGGNGDWNVPSNWRTENGNGLPAGCAANVIIPSGAPFVTTVVSVGNVEVLSGIELSASGSLKVCGNFAGGKDSAAVIAGLGKVILNGSAAQLLTRKSTIHNLELNNTAGATIVNGSVVNITGIYTPSAGTLITNGGLILKSSANGTAIIAQGTTDYISGPVTVERYIPAKRAYRFLTAPVNSVTTIKENWMENTNNENTSVNHNPLPGCGTHITGNGGATNGFDATATNNPSLFTFNNQTQVWMPVTNTSGRFNVGSPYRVMVRGSRSTNLNSNEAMASVTTLRATGSVVTGTVVLAKPGASGTTGMPELSTSINGYSFIANPYPAVVDWKKLKKKDISKSIYYYDPSLSGSSGRGAYVTYNDLLDMVSVPGSKVDNYIQSGQAFFVQTTGPDPSLTFTEDSKAATQKVIFRETGIIPHISAKLLLPGQENTQTAADGFAAYFSNDFDSSIGDEDSYKLTNLDENIGIVRNGKTLSIEGRKLVVETDTLPLKMWQMTQSNYMLKVSVSDIDNVVAYLEDLYLNSRYHLINNAETTIPFSLNADQASAASDRFKIVFKPLATLPIHINNVKAYEKDKDVYVQWNVQNETGIREYIVEKSTDMQAFKEVASVVANNKGTETYTQADLTAVAGDNFYRIKIIENTGAISYSQIVKVRLTKSVQPSFTVYPNPVTDKKVVIQLMNIPQGEYSLTMYDQSGREVFKDKINHQGNLLNRQVLLPIGTAPGSCYFLLKGVENLLSFKQSLLVLQ